MKNSISKIAIFHLFLILLVFLFGCNNDFLNKEYYLVEGSEDTIKMTSFDSEIEFEIRLSSVKNAKWSLFQSPALIAIEPRNGEFIDGKSVIRLKNEEINNGYGGDFGVRTIGLQNRSVIFDVEGIGLVVYPLSFFEYGTPVGSIQPNDIVLDSKYFSSISISNYNRPGILHWEIKELPSWINVSKTKGVLYPGKHENVGIYAIRDNLNKGDYTGRILVSTNMVENTKTIGVSMKVQYPSISGSNIQIEGNVVDADFCKKNGLLAIATKQPDRIYFYKPGGPVSIMEPKKVPVCICLNENGDALVANFTNTDVSLIDVEQKTILKNYQSGMIASDVNWGNNEWVYLSPRSADSSRKIKSVNLTTGEIVTTGDIYNGNYLFKKVPNKGVLYGSREYSSYLSVFNISEGPVNNKIMEVDLESGRFWFADDATRMFCGNGKIFKIFDYSSTLNYSFKPEIAGELPVLNKNILTLDQSSVSKEIFATYKTEYYGNTFLARIDDDGYYTKKTYVVNDYVFEDNGQFQVATINVVYMFIDKSGEILHLIKLSQYNEKRFWFYETINIKSLN